MPPLVPFAYGMTPQSTRPLWPMMSSIERSTPAPRSVVSLGWFDAWYVTPVVR